jgi:membrane protease YdiL (CAAX protease family)
MPTAATLVALAVALVAAKATQLRWWPDSGGMQLLPGLVRQCLLGAALVVFLRARRRPVDVGLFARSGRWWLVALVAVGLVLQGATDPSGLSVPNLILVTALGEEILFRGLLPAAAGLRARSGRVATFGPALAFGLWHVPDGWSGGPIAVLGVALATSAAAVLIFEPLRRRARSVLAPAAAHALINGIGILIAGW